MSTLSEHERIEAEIDRKGLSTDPFASAVRATRMPMIITDPHLPDNPIVFVNDAFLNLTGYRRDEMLGSNCRLLQGPDTDKSDVTKVRDAIARQEAIEIELLNYKKNGETFWNRLLVSPVFDDERKITYFFASQYDVSVEREAARGLRELNETLEQRVAHDRLVHGKVEEQLRQSQKMEAVGQLTGGVAHDFNNLLTVIRGAVDLLRRPNLSEQKRQRYLEAISETTTRATKLTGQLLAFARRQALKPEVLDVGKNVASVSELIATLIGVRVRLELVPADERLHINVDPSQFDTALVNMAVNARDAMNGEGRLTITVFHTNEVPEMRAHSAVSGDFVAISVSDTGSGIPEDQIDRIFEPFFTTKAVGQGTGLGLSQVFGFAKQSGGEVMVENAAASGAVFTLYLPRVYSEAHLAAPAGELVSARERTACVLVVEDNKDVGDFALQALNELGHRTVLATDAREALAELRNSENQFDVIFSDVVMPGMSGVELGKEVRRLYPNLPIILTSGYSHVLAQDTNHGFELLHKPYSMTELSSALDKVINAKRCNETGACK